MNATYTLETQGKGAKKRGKPIWIVLVIVLVMALAAITALGFTLYYLKSEKLKTQRLKEEAVMREQRSDAEQRKAADDAQRSLARNQQEQVLAQLRAITNTLVNLLAESDAARSEAGALCTNQAGRAVALHPDLVAIARHFYEATIPSIPSKEEIVMRLESTRRIEQQLVANLGTAYQPGNDLGATVKEITEWANRGKFQVEQARQTLASLVQESKIKVTQAAVATNSVSLEMATVRVNQQQAEERMRVTEQTVSTARADAELERAKAAGEKILAEAQRVADEIRTKLREEKAAMEREFKEREAGLKVEEVKTKVAVQEKEEQARNLELRKKAKDPAVQTKLAPFTTPGYAQVNVLVPDLQPLSYSRLLNSGALAANLRGMGKLVTIASMSGDKVRPRWKMNPLLFTRHPDEIEEVREVQQLLIELGPVLVEMGSLTP